MISSGHKLQPTIFSFLKLLALFPIGEEISLGVEGDFLKKC